MAPHWQSVLEHVPLVSMVASNQVNRFEFKDLIGSLVVGVASAVFASYITVKELSVEMRYTSQRLAALETVVSQKLEIIGKEYQEARERLTRLEEKAIINYPQNGMNGSRK